MFSCCTDKEDVRHLDRHSSNWSLIDTKKRSRIRTAFRTNELRAALKLILQGEVTITPSNFWDDGCYRQSLARPNMGVIGVNDTSFPSLQPTFSLFPQFFPNFQKILRLFRFFHNFRTMGVNDTLK